MKFISYVSSTAPLKEQVEALFDITPEQAWELVRESEYKRVQYILTQAKMLGYEKRKLN